MMKDWIGYILINVMCIPLAIIYVFRSHAIWKWELLILILVTHLIWNYLMFRKCNGNSYIDTVVCFFRNHRFGYLRKIQFVLMHLLFFINLIYIFGILIGIALYIFLFFNLFTRCYLNVPLLIVAIAMPKFFDICEREFLLVCEEIFPVYLLFLLIVTFINFDMYSYAYLGSFAESFALSTPGKWIAFAGVLGGIASFFWNIESKL